jgi:D-3-phosphoglycerate dehydrogenase
VRGKTLGIVGYGHAGSQMGVMAEALSLKVLFYDITSIMPIGRAEPCASLESLLAASDFVALNVSSLESNVKMFGAKQFATMKQHSYFINTSFGDAVDHDALADSIKSGHLGGAAIDVYPSKSNTAPNPLVGLKNVILTPRIGNRLA